MSDENQESDYHNHTISGVLGGLLIGGLAGATAMFLLAPQSGKKTRMQIQQKSIELRDRTSDMVGDLLSQVSSDTNKMTKEGRQKAKNLLHQGQALVIEQLDHVSDAAKAGKKAIQSA